MKASELTGGGGDSDEEHGPRVHAAEGSAVVFRQRLPDGFAAVRLLRGGGRVVPDAVNGHAALGDLWSEVRWGRDWGF